MSRGRLVAHGGGNMASTADDDARANVLKSLGVARRGRADAASESELDVADEADAAPDGADAAPDGADAAPEGASDEAPAQGAVAPGLGIRRRVKPAEGAANPAAKAEGGAGAGSGLGIKRRSGSAPAPAADGEDAAADPAPKRKLGNDQVALMLAGYFRSRPQAELPERVFELTRTHGFYNGDGRAERKLTVGFEPAFVLYILPVYPENIWPTYEKPDYKPIDPGLHRQPRFVADGFIVDEPYNVLGESYMYVAFRSDGQPLELPDTSAHVEPVRKATTGLGIRRRK